MPRHTVKELLYKPRGLVLVTGPTGSGKTTTLASMINIINEERDDAHIITIEDPIEYYHKHKKALVTQREVHVDVPSFAEALRRALRQDPDVILVGELRDLETMEAAITAAETGHLVFGTLHTTGAAKTIDRLVNAFPINQQETIRIQLSTVLQAVISQLLLPRIDKPGRIAVFEIMINTPSIAALIRDNKTFRIKSDIQTGAKYGMVTLDGFLMEKYSAGPDLPRGSRQQIPGPRHHHAETGGMGSGPGRSAAAHRKPEMSPILNPWPRNISSPLLATRSGPRPDWTTCNWRRSTRSTIAAASPSCEILQDFGFMDMDSHPADDRQSPRHRGRVDLSDREFTPGILLQPFRPTPPACTNACPSARHDSHRAGRPGRSA